jgi:hypothetical protein
MKRTVILHPYLFAAYSVIGVYSQNASQVPVDWTFRSLVVSLSLAVALFYFLKWLLKDAERAGFLTSLFLIWMSMGHVYRLLLEISHFWQTIPGRFIVLLAISLPFVLLASSRVWKKITNRKLVTGALNTMSLVLVVFPLIGILSTLPRESVQVQTLRARLDQIGLPQSMSSESSPDIYVIILDRYGRADILQNVYGFDNSEFINFLEKKGFYVADRSTTNYPQTELSLSSLLHFRYLDEHVAGFGDASGRAPLRELLQSTAVRGFLEGEGYRMVALPSAALFAQIRDADVYVGLAPGDVNEFEGLLLSTSLIGIAAESLGVDLPVAGYEMHRRYILFSFEALVEVQKIPGPKFVFAHILSPHPPFIFDGNGKYMTPDYPYSSWDASLYPGLKKEYITGYTGQMTFVNRKLEEAIDAILDNSEAPPVIVIQGDHGPGVYYDMLKLDDSCLSERFSILNAYYFPDGDYQSLYPKITPVNTFRVILNKYFDTSLDMIDDRNYFAGWLSPYQFTDVTAKVDLVCNPAVVGSP